MATELDGLSGAILDPGDKAYSQTVVATKRVLDYNRRAANAAARLAVLEVNNLGNDIFGASHPLNQDSQMTSPPVASPHSCGSTMSHTTSTPLSQRNCAPRALSSTLEPSYHELMMEVDRIAAQYGEFFVGTS